MSTPAYFSAVAQAAPDILSSVVEGSRTSLLVVGPTLVPFANQVGDCITELLADKVPSGDTGIIPATNNGFWDTFGKKRGPPGLQRGICAFLDNSILQQRLVDPATPRQEVQRLHSTAGKNAGGWLTSYPVCEPLSLADDDFGFAVRHRLGLPCASGLPRSCDCGTDLSLDMAHFHSCHRLRGTAVRFRHDLVVKILAGLFRKVGAQVHVEPRIYGKDRDRPDLDVMLPNQSVMIDVTVVHPAAPSRTSITALATVSAAEKKKRDRYTQFATKHGANFLPFAIETFGCFGVSAVQVLKLLRQASGGAFFSIPASSLGTYAAQCLSVGLQRGNGMVSRRGAVAARASAHSASGLSGEA